MKSLSKKERQRIKRGFILGLPTAIWVGKYDMETLGSVYETLTESQKSKSTENLIKRLRPKS